MGPNGMYGGGTFWGPDSLVFPAAAVFDWRNSFSGLPEEIKAYLSEHEGEIRSEQDVERLIRLADLKK